MDQMDYQDVDHNQETKKNRKMTSRIGSTTSTDLCTSSTLYRQVLTLLLMHHRLPLLSPTLLKKSHQSQKKLNRKLTDLKLPSPTTMSLAHQRQSRQMRDSRRFSLGSKRYNDPPTRQMPLTKLLCGIVRSSSS